jgi:hypothetical protein
MNVSQFGDPLGKRACLILAFFRLRISDIFCPAKSCAILSLVFRTPRGQAQRRQWSAAELPAGVRPCEPSHPQIIKELRWRVDARHEQMTPRTGVGDVQQVPFGIIDLFQVRIVDHRLDPCLQGNDLIITRHVRSLSCSLHAPEQGHFTSGRFSQCCNTCVARAKHSILAPNCAAA